MKLHRRKEAEALDPVASLVRAGSICTSRVVVVTTEVRLLQAAAGLLSLLSAPWWIAVEKDDSAATSGPEGLEVSKATSSTSNATSSTSNADSRATGMLKTSEFGLKCTFDPQS
jgi:hypothetical protein